MRNWADVGDSRKNIGPRRLDLVIVIDVFDKLVLLLLSYEMALGSLHVVLMENLIQRVARIIRNDFAQIDCLLP